MAYLKLLIAKMKRERFGQSAERGRKLFDQLELQLEELEASATEDIVAAGPVEPDPLRLSAGHSFPLSPFIRLGVSANNLCRSQVAAPISSSTSSVSPGNCSLRQKRAAPPPIIPFIGAREEGGLRTPKAISASSAVS